MIKGNNHTCFEDRNTVKKQYKKACSTDAVIY